MRGASVALWAVAVVTALGYAALAPAVVNGDGLGYLKAALAGAVYPGHLGYVPLLRLIGRGAARPVDALVAARALSVGSSVVAVLALGGAARRLGGDGLVAAAGLAASFGMIAAGSDVESYAPALAALCLGVYSLARRRTGGPVWSVVAALATTLATLLHIENALFALPLFFALQQSRARAGRGEAVLAVAGAGLMVAAAYALLLPAGDSLRSASHGFHYPLRPWTPFVALYGAAKALVYSPYPYEASWARVLGCFAVGATALAVAGRLARDGGAPLGRAATLAWALPYSLVGVAFFGSDSERWVFLLPLLWLSVAASLRARFALGLAAALASVNLALWLPLERDDGFRLRAAAAGRHAQPGDLVISPGHGWDEYLGFYDGPAVESFPLVYYAGALGGREPLGRAVGAAIRRTLAAGHRVLLARLDDARDPLGWKELRLFGVGPAEAAALLPPGRRTPLGDGVALFTPD